MIKKDFEIDRDSRLYPELLRQIPNPPKKLFCRGNPELLECRKVAVVGSGPSGLSCAYYLKLNGYAVTVFEAQKELGGVL